MKRVTLVLAGLLCAAALIAQARPPRTQTGNATQEMQTPGLSAGHNSLPIGSKAKIRSLSNGREIEVTITETIPTSTRRIIDLSPTAALALELGFGGPVIVTPLGPLQGQADSPQQIDPQPIAPPPPQPQQIPSFASAEPELPGYLPEYQPEPMFDLAPEPVAAVAPPPPPPPPPPPEPVLEWDIEPEPAPPPPPAPMPAPAPAPVQSSSPQTIINNYYIMSAEDFQRLQKGGALPFDSSGAMSNQGVQPKTGPAAPPVTYSTYTAPPVSNVRIIPALPSPHSGKTYRLLVGSYPAIDTAFHVFRQLKAAGFDAVQEQAGNMCRVLVVGIPAPSVFYAAQRLGAIGFEQVWIQE